jgi:outer membrane protein assembly factor BamB
MFLVGLTPPEGRTLLVVFDARGKAIWRERASRPTLQSQILSNGTVVWARSFRDGYGVNPEMAEEVHSLSGRRLRLIHTRGTVTDGHELQVAPGGDIYLDSYSIRDDVDLSRFGGRPHASVADAEVQELSPDGDLLWRWNSRNHIRLDETGRWWRNNVVNNTHIVDGRKTYDAIHINSIDPQGDTIVISSRHTDAVYGISRRTGKILWKLGGTPTARSLQVIGDPNSPELFGGQHDARLWKNGLLSVYDDATHLPRAPRAAFYRIHPRRGTATFVGQLTDPLVKRSHCCGSVRPFEGGWLVDWGDNPLVTAFDPKGRITFRLHLPVSSYRAVPVPATVTEATLRRLSRRCGSRPC